MKTPKYAEVIIVGIHDSSGFNWHISDRDMWIMDIYKYQSAYKKMVIM